MQHKFDDEIYIPDEEMKVPDSHPYTDNSSQNHLLRHLVTILIIAGGLAALAFAGLYLYDVYNTPNTPPVETPNRPTADENQEPESPTARAQVETMQALSPSDTLPAILTDLENTNLTNIDEEVTAIESELE